MTPLDIRADRDAGTVEVQWDDGHHSRYSCRTLRWACPCALCKGEWGRPGRLDSLTELPPDELTMTDINLVGAYGMTPVWASGHDTGIYSFEYLRSLCDCEDCTADRRAE